MEPFVIYTCSIYFFYRGVREQYQDDSAGIYQENEQKQHHNDNFWPF